MVSELKDLLNIQKTYLKSDLDLNSEEHAYFSDTISEDELNPHTAQSLYKKLVRGVVNFNRGNLLQRKKIGIQRRFFALQVLNQLGFIGSFISMAERLITDCELYSFHAEASQISRFLFRHYTTRVVDLELAKSYYEKSVYHGSIYQSEIEFDWQFSLVKSKNNTDDFFYETDHINKILLELSKKQHSSTRLKYIYFELNYYKAFILEDKEQIEKVCREAIEFFKSLPYEHYLGVNVFTFHLLELHQRMGEFAKTELLVNSTLRSITPSVPSLFRYQEFLTRSYLYQGNTIKSADKLSELDSQLNSLENAKFRGRLHLYELYLGILTSRNVDLSQIHQDMRQFHQQVEYTAPLLIGKVVYFLLRKDRTNARLTMVHLINYSELYLNGKHAKTISFIAFLQTLLERGIADSKIHLFSSNKKYVSPIEVVRYDLLQELLKGQLAH